MSMPRTARKRADTGVPADAVDNLDAANTRWAMGEGDRVHRHYLAMIADKIIGKYYRVSGDLVRTAPGIKSAIYVKSIRGPFVAGSFVEISEDGEARVIGEFLVHASVVDLTTPMNIDKTPAAAPKSDAGAGDDVKQEGETDAKSKETAS